MPFTTLDHDLVSRHVGTGGPGNNVIDGWEGDDTIVAGAGDDRLVGGIGTNTIDGGDGIDTAAFSGNFANYSITLIDSKVLVTRLTGSASADTLVNVEILQFADQTLQTSSISPPTITSAANSGFFVGRSNSFSVTATGAPPPTFSIITGTLPTGLTLNSTTGVISGTPVSGSNGVYNLVIKAANGIAPDSSQAFTLTVDTPLTVENLNIAGGLSQRSKVATIKLTFSKEVQIDPGAFSLVKNNSGASVGNITVVATLVNGKTEVTLTFSGANVASNGSLTDGRWTLSINANNVHDAAAPQSLLEADYINSQSIYRLEGDLDGDGTITNSDLQYITSNFGKKVNSPDDLLAIADFNGDGSIGNPEVLFIRRILGRTIS